MVVIAFSRAVVLNLFGMTKHLKKRIIFEKQGRKIKYDL